MSDDRVRVRQIIPEQVMLARLAQSEQMREFFIQMWKQNPTLAMQGGSKVKNLMSPLEYDDTKTVSSPPRSGGVKIGNSQRGISLIELIMFIVIVSVALAGILLVMNVTTKGSADPLIHKQAIAAAESLLEEIQLQDFSPPSGVASAGTMNAADDRTAGYHTVLNYHQFPLDDGTGIYPLSGGTPITGLANYRAKVTVESPLAADWNGILAASAALITVTVYDPQNNDIQISGYRTAY